MQCAKCETITYDVFTVKYKETLDVNGDKV